MAPNGSGRTAAWSSRRHGRSRSKAAGSWAAAGGASSVDTAHAVYRDLLDQKFLGRERLGFVLIGGRCDGGTFGHEYLLLRGTGCHSIGTGCRQSRLRPGQQSRNRSVTGRKMATGRAVVISGAVVDDVSGAGRLPG